jgi:stage II sporulation protein D
MKEQGMTRTIKNIMSILLITLTFVLTFSIINIEFTMAASDEPSYMRIGLKYGSSTADTYEAVFENGVIIGYGDNNDFIESTTFDDIVKVCISLSGEQINLIGTKNSGESINLIEDSTEINCVMPVDYNDGGTMSFLGSKYRGGIAFNVTSGKLTIINLVPFEEYLYGVINGELNCSNPIEALKAQTVAARSYAIDKLGTHNSYGFDLCATTHCQVYKGYDDEHNQTNEAVDETAGETIQYDGETVAAFFYKNSGGYTQDVADVWNGSAEYLKAVKDEYSPTYSWTQSYTFDELASKLSSAGYNIGTVLSVAITNRNQSGAVNTLQFTGTGGTIELQKEKIRTVFGASVLKSTMFSFSEYPTIVTTADKVFKGYIYSKNTSNNRSLSEEAYVIGKNGILTLVDTEDMFIHNGTSTTKVSNMENSTGASAEAAKGLENISSGNIVFFGLGYGHGIGMPQDSAVEMARQGFTYEEILKYYYTDITID